MKAWHKEGWSHFPVLVEKTKRDKIIAYLTKLGVEIGIIVDYSVSSLFAYQKLGYKVDINSDETSKRVINLPLTYMEGLFFNNRWRDVAHKVIDILGSF